MQPDQPRPLTPAETDVLQRAARGCAPMKRLARERSCGEDTIRKHLTAAREKLGAVNTTHAVYLALSRGLIT